MQISVVIPSYNSQSNIENTLKAISNQEFDGNFETIVVDCSEHDQVKDICHQFSFVRYQHEQERFNPGIGRNIGAKLATGELLIFVDADVVLDSSAFLNAWDYYKDGHFIFGGALELNLNAKPNIASYLEHYFFNHESQPGRPKCIRSNLSSALMLFKRELFIEKAGFKDIPRMQDTEMTERLIKQGLELTFNPKVLGYQIQDSPLDKVLRKIFINGKNLYFIRYENFSSAKKLALFILLPLITSFKVFRIFARHLRYQNIHGRLITILISPLLYLGGIYWMFGLYNSMIFGGEISKKRD